MNRFLVRVPTVVISGYVLGISLLQQFGYWNSFDVNILQYATLMDLAKYSVWPLMSLAGLTAVSVAAQGGAMLTREESRRVKLATEPTLGGIRGLSRRWLSVVMLTVLLIASAFAVTNDGPGAWASLGGVLGLIAYAFMYAIELDPLKRFVRDNAGRRLLTCMLVIAPCAMWGIGKQAASDILNGRHYTQALVSVDLLAQNSLLPAQELRYLGSTADFSFFLIYSHRTVWVVRNDSLAGMKLETHEKEEPPSLLGKWLDRF